MHMYKTLLSHILSVYFLLQLTIVPGETALAFYTAKNPTNKPIIGIATYTVLPQEAAKYFNKIQVSCPWMYPNIDYVN